MTAGRSGAPIFTSLLVGTCLFAGTALAADEIQVKDLEVFQADGVTEIYIETDAPPVFESTSRKDPPVVIVDLVNAHGARDVASPGGVLKSLSFKDVTARSGRKVSRLTLRFDRQITYDVTAERTIVRVRIFHDGKAVRKGPRMAMGTSARHDDFRSDATPVHLAQEDSAGASTDDGSGGGGTRMTYIGFNNKSDSSRVFVRLSSSNAKYTVKKEGDNLIVLEIPNATIPLDNNKNYLDTTFFDSPVKMITPSEVEDDPPSVRVTIEMKENVPYEDKREGNEISLYFKK